MRAIPFGELKGAARHGPLGLGQSSVEGAKWLVEPTAG
jgi:hypothetical protein